MCRREGDAADGSASVQPAARSDSRHNGIFLVLVAAGLLATIAIFAPLALRPGWPNNHEGLNEVSRIAAIARQWMRGDLLPVWSGELQNGHGSPMPGLYHKLFLYVGAAVLILTESAKAAILLTAAFFSFLMFMGTALAARVALGPRAVWLPIAAGWLASTSNYATTDWLVRAAFAEHSAMALAAFLFAWGLALIRTGRWSMWLAPLMAGICLAHTGIGLFSPVLVIVATICAGLVHGFRWRAWLIRAVGCAVIATVLVTPFILPMLAFDGFDSRTALLVPEFHPLNNLQSIKRYLWDVGWNWGDTWQTYTVQLDLYVVPALVLGVSSAILLRRRRIKVEGAIVLFLLAVFGIFFFLQTDASVPLWSGLRPLQYLQFPWRLLVFISLAGALLLPVSIGTLMRLNRSRGMNRGMNRGLAVACLGACIVSFNANPGWSGIRYPWFTAADVEGAVKADMWAGGEYLPRMVHAEARASIRYLENLLSQPQTGACNIAAGPVEPGSLRVIRLTCSRAEGMILPIFAAPGLELWLERDGLRQPLPFTRTCSDPRAHVQLPEGQSQVVAMLPTWQRLLSHRWQGRSDWMMPEGCAAGSRPAPDAAD